MSDINPNNFEGATVTLVGHAGDDVQFKSFDNGGSVAELSIAVGQGYKKDGQWVSTGTTWYRLIANGDYADNNWPTIHKGDKVRLDEGRLETRDFPRKDGTTGQAFEVRFGNLSVIESKSGGDPEKPF